MLEESNLRLVEDVKFPEDDKADVNTLVTRLEAIQSSLYELKQKEAVIKAALAYLYKAKIEDAYRVKNEPFGTVTIKDSGLKIKFDIPKKVEWDQEGLAKLHAEGAPVKVEYGVSETLFKSLNDAGKGAFMPYRTVKPGTTAITVERE